jgi:hypothetical protein
MTRTNIKHAAYRLWIIFLTGVFWCASSALLLAQEDATGGKDNKSYVPSYTMVVVLIGIAIFVVCRPLHRAEAERQDYFGAAPKGIKGEDFHD